MGAWVWAWGSHVCNGKIGTLTANAMANEAKSQRAVVGAKSPCSAIVTRSKVSWPPFSWLNRNAVARTPTSMKAEPAIVNRKNLTAA